MCFHKYSQQKFLLLLLQLNKRLKEKVPYDKKITKPHLKWN
jgi:hypothetical protein